MGFSEVAELKVEHLDCTGGYLHVVDGKGGRVYENAGLDKLLKTAIRSWMDTPYMGSILRF